MGRNRLMASAAIALTLAGGSLAGAGVASAGPTDYLYDVHNNGRIAGPDGQLLAWGRHVCTASGQGVPAAQTVNTIYNSTQLNNWSDAQFIYESALLFLC
jgi:hypothetical protein